MDPSGSVRNGGSGKLLLIDGNGGVESVGVLDVDRPGGGPESPESAGLEMLASVGAEIAGFGGLEIVASGVLDNPLGRIPDD
jgi:hypothetical protein